MTLEEALASRATRTSTTSATASTPAGASCWIAAGVGARFGLRAAAGLDIGGEADGLLPTPAWRKQTFKSYWDRAWNPGDSIQLAIGQKDVTVTPLQMARFYAMIANGGKLVTPHLVAAVEPPGSSGRPVTLRRLTPDPPREAGVDPAALEVVRGGLYSATHSRDGTLVGDLRHLSDPDRGQDGDGGEGRPAPRLPGRSPRGSVLVVRVRARRRGAHRRLRADRERRSRRHRRRTRGAEGVRAVLRRQGWADGGREDGLIVEAGTRQGRCLAPARAGELGFLLRRLDWVLLFATAALVAYGLWAVSGITRFDVPGDPDFYVVRQAIAVGIGAVALVVAIVVPPTLYLRHWRIVYGVTIGLMILVLLAAEAIRGSRRWIDIGPFQFQPSEFGKVLFVLAIAGFLVERSRRIRRLPTVLTAVGLAGAPVILVFLAARPRYGARRTPRHWRPCCSSRACAGSTSRSSPSPGRSSSRPCSGSYPRSVSRCSSRTRRHGSPDSRTRPTTRAV